MTDELKGETLPCCYNCGCDVRPEDEVSGGTCRRCKEPLEYPGPTSELEETRKQIKELVEAVEDVDKNSDCPDIDVHNARCIRRASAIAKAKEGMK